MLSFALVWAISFFYSAGQKPDQLLEQWAKKAPIEKIHLHLDRENYMAGETIWFKAYLLSDYFPGSASTSLYVELVGAGNKVIEKKTLPLLLGASNGQIELPDSLPMGHYTVRAFTPAMNYLSPDFIFKKGIYIHGKKKNEDPGGAVVKTNLDFFPEGGNLVAGFTNMIAFKATDEDGLPVAVSGKIKNSKGEEITSFSEHHDGMGMFELSVAGDEKYFATINNSNEKFPLPDASDKGIALSVIPHPQGNFFEIQQKLTDPAFVAAYMVGQMQHNVVFRQDLNKTKASVQGVINTQHLRSGILQVTFFNQNGMPLAERLCFVNNQEFLQPAELLLDTINFSARSRNRFRLSFRDTVQANLSVSITDATYDHSRYENILTNFLLSADLEGYVHRPSYYFSSGSDSVKTALDLLMMTNGWRRFKWTELAKQTAPVFPDPAYIEIDGRATLKGTNRPFDGKNILLMIGSMVAKKKSTTHILETDKNGNFFIDSLLFYGKNRLIFSDVRGKKSQYIDIKLKADSLNRGFAFPGFSLVPGRVIRSGNTAWQMDYEAILKEKGLMLEGITVTGKTKTAAEQVDERYTSGLFVGDASKTIDLVNSDDAQGYSNIFDYLQFRVNGLDVGSDGFDYSVFYRQGVSMSSMGNIGMKIYLDEVETHSSVIATIPANQIALVKIFSSFAAADGNAPGGLLAIYTKKSDDYQGGSAGITNVSIYNGYSVIKEFYAPDYKLNKGPDKADNRITLDWRPNIFVNNVDARIPVSFFNNDRTKQFKVVVEGMTKSGKFIWVEKIITGK